jgi:hypothetical protein
MPTNAWLALAVLCFAVMARAQAGQEPQGPQRLPVPDTMSQLRAERTIREIFRHDYAEAGAEQRRELAQRLLQQARQTGDDPAGRYVLLREARNIAAGAGDAATGGRALREMCRLYAEDPAPAALVMLITAHRSARSAEALAEVGRTALQIADDVALADDYDRAAQLLSLAQRSAQQAGDAGLVERVAARVREVQTIATAHAQLGPAREALAADADDPQANLIIGRFTCAIRNDWETGLPHLVRGADPSLARLALLDLSGPADAGQRLELANGWWEQASLYGELSCRHLRARAGSWYREALPGLSGLSRSLALKRIEEIEALALAELNLRPGLVAELFGGTGLSERIGRRIDAQVDFDWGEDAPDPSMPRDNFSIRWTGLLRPPAAGHYELILIANMGARVWIDEQLIADEPNLSRSRSGRRIPVELKGPLHALRIEYWDTGGIARMHLHWVVPGSEKPQPVPASAFYHESAP